MARRELIVTGTAWRPSFLRVVVISRNNLAPSASFDEHALRVKILQTNTLPWPTIRKASVHKGLASHYCVVQSGSSDYLLYFRELEDLAVLLEALRDRNIHTDVPAPIQAKLDNL